MYSSFCSTISMPCALSRSILPGVQSEPSGACSNLRELGHRSWQKITQAGNAAKTNSASAEEIRQLKAAQITTRCHAKKMCPRGKQIGTERALNVFSYSPAQDTNLPHSHMHRRGAENTTRTDTNGFGIIFASHHPWSAIRCFIEGQQFAP